MPAEHLQKPPPPHSLSPHTQSTHTIHHCCHQQQQPNKPRFQRSETRRPAAEANPRSARSSAASSPSLPPPPPDSPLLGPEPRNECWPRPADRLEDKLPRAGWQQIETEWVLHGKRRRVCRRSGRRNRKGLMVAEMEGGPRGRGWGAGRRRRW